MKEQEKKKVRRNTVPPLLKATAFTLAKDAGMSSWRQALPEARRVLKERVR